MRNPRTMRIRRPAARVSIVFYDHHISPLPSVFLPLELHSPLRSLRVSSIHPYWHRLVSIPLLRAFTIPVFPIFLSGHVTKFTSGFFGGGPVVEVQIMFVRWPFVSFTATFLIARGSFTSGSFSFAHLIQQTSYVLYNSDLYHHFTFVVIVSSGFSL